MISSRLVGSIVKDAEKNLEKVLRMKPSDFLVEFLPSPDIFFSDETRVVSEEYRDHSYYYLAGRYAGRVRGGLAEVNRILQEKNYILVPALRKIEQLPVSGGSEGRVEPPRRGLTRPRPSTLDIGFMKELVYIHLEKRIRNISGCLSCGSHSLSVCCVCSRCVNEITRSLASQTEERVFCP